MRDNSKQASFADFLLGNRTKVTRTEKLLQRINEEVDFSFAHEVHNKLHKSKTGRKPYPAVLMYKIVLLQNLFGLSDAGAEETIYDRKSFQDFLGLNLNLSKLKFTFFPLQSLEKANLQIFLLHRQFLVLVFH